MTNNKLATLKMIKDPNMMPGIQIPNLTPAMLTALFQKSYDRQFVTDLETSILSFVDSSAQSYELKPMNSYYRLLAHQIAEYHNLHHTLARSQDKCLIIFKGDTFKKMTCMPLLQHVQPFMVMQPTSMQPTNMLPVSQPQYFPEVNHIKKIKLLRKSPIPDIIEGSEQEFRLEKKTQIVNEADEVGDKVSRESISSGDKEVSESALEQKKIEREREYELRKKEIYDTAKDEDEEAGKADSDYSDQDTGYVIPTTPEKKKHIGSYFETQGDSPQPHQFETSRYQIKQQQQNDFKYAKYGGFKYNQTSYYNYNGNYAGNNKSYNRQMPYNNLNQTHMHYNTYSIPRMGYASPPQPSGTGQFPMMYPNTFPMEGHTGYMPQVVYHPIVPTQNVSDPALMAPYSQYSYQFQYYPYQNSRRLSMPYYPYQKQDERLDSFKHQHNDKLNIANNKKSINKNGYGVKISTTSVSSSSDNSNGQDTVSSELEVSDLENGMEQLSVA